MSQQQDGASQQPISIQPGQSKQSGILSSQPDVLVQDQPQGIAGPDTPGCPPDLESLSRLDKLMVTHEGGKTIKYKVTDGSKKALYFADDDIEQCNEECLGISTCFTMNVKDTEDKEVIRVSRDLNCLAGYRWFACTEGCTIEAPAGNIVGYVRQRPSCLEHRFSIQDASREEILYCAGLPLGTCVIPCCKQQFKLFSRDGEAEVGTITRDGDTFEVSFPMELDVKIKAATIGAVFLIGFLFFEEHPNLLWKRVKKVLCFCLKLAEAGEE